MTALPQADREGIVRGKALLGRSVLSIVSPAPSLQPANLFTLFYLQLALISFVRQKGKQLMCAARAVSTAERRSRDKPGAEEVLRDTVAWLDLAKPFQRTQGPLENKSNKY